MVVLRVYFARATSGIAVAVGSGVSVDGGKGVSVAASMGSTVVVAVGAGVDDDVQDETRKMKKITQDEMILFRMGCILPLVEII
jgi:co-chaperonin GroES (HSP10)